MNKIDFLAHNQQPTTGAQRGFAKKTYAKAGSEAGGCGARWGRGVSSPLPAHPCTFCWPFPTPIHTNTSEYFRCVVRGIICWPLPGFSEVKRNPDDGKKLSREKDPVFPQKAFQTDCALPQAN